MDEGLYHADYQVKIAAKNGFVKNFFKLVNTSVFGETMQNIRNHNDMKLVQKVSK